MRSCVIQHHNSAVFACGSMVLADLPKAQRANCVGPTPNEEASEEARLRMSWKYLEDQRPELAAFGAERLHGNVAYLATVRKDGSPRVHPITPIIGQGHLFLFMEPTSPKGHDLRRDQRYALHCSVSDNSGGSGEVIVAGRARFIDDPELRALAAQLASYTPADRYILFELDVESATSTIYTDAGPVRQQWNMQA
jgi:hypothetical protein